MNLKRILAIVICAAMVLSVFAGCGKNSTPAQNNSANTVPAENTQPDAPAVSEEEMEKLIDIAQDRGFTMLQRLAVLCYCAEDISEALQDEDCERLKKISGMLAIDGFRMEIVIQAEKDILSGDVRALGRQGLDRLFAMFAGMEYMGDLGERFTLTEDIRDKMLAAEKAFNKDYAPYQHELENILVYFLYRYFIKCTRDYAAEERLFSAVYMTLAARGLFLREYAEKGALPDIDRRILLVKELSKEVEYDSDNMDIIYDEIQQCADTRDMLCGLCFQGDI